VKRGGPKNIVASVQARLAERSRELGVEHQLMLARFGGERLLYRLSKSEFTDRFILKGAALLLMWLAERSDGEARRMASRACCALPGSTRNANRSGRSLMSTVPSIAKMR
jgi:hypothetical protein